MTTLGNSMRVQENKNENSLGFLRAGGRGSWRVGLHGQALVFVVLELQDLFGWFLV